MEEALDVSAQTIEGARLAAAVVLSRGIHRDDGLHAPLPDRAYDRVGVLPRICDESFAGPVLDQVLLASVESCCLAGREDDAERLPFAGGDRVELGRKTSSSFRRRGDGKARLLAVRRRQLDQRNLITTSRTETNPYWCTE